MKKYALADFLLSMQVALWGYIDPSLRAVVLKFDQTNQILTALFYFELEITDDLLEIVSCIYVESSSDFVLPGEQFDFQAITLLPSAPCPIEGHLIYHRYEPEFAPPDQSGCITPFAHAPWYARLVAQQALLGMVTPSLRAIVVEYEMENKKVLFHFEYDGEVTEFLRNLVTEVIRRAKALFPEGTEIRHKIAKIEKSDIVSEKKNIWFVYIRKEL